MFRLGHAENLVQIQWQADGERRTYAGRAFGIDGSVVVLNDLGVALLEPRESPIFSVI